WEQLTFNLDNPALSDPAVRQAFAYAVNRKALNDDVFNGKGEVAVSQVPSWSWAYKQSPQNADFNAGMAEQVLDRARWRRGARPLRHPPNGLIASDLRFGEPPRLVSTQPHGDDQR